MSKNSLIAIIPAGGIGKRMNAQKPKQFLTINDEPILLITLRALASTGLITKFVVPTVDLVYTKKIIKSALPDLNVTVIKGGKTRQESIYKALQEIKSTDDSSKFILIHDAVRALVRKETIERVIAKAKEKGAAIAARPVTDTLKLTYVDDDGDIAIKKNVSRDLMWVAQTPQVFSREIIYAAYEKAKKDRYEGTDSAGLVERIGKEVYIVQGRPSNIKITTSDDLALAETYYKILN